MNKTATWIRKAVVCAMALAIASSVVAEEVKAKVTRVKGSARYSTDSTNWKTLKTGQMLSSGMVVQTAQDSIVDLVLGSEDVLATSPQIVENFTVQPPPNDVFQALVTPDTVRIFADSVMAIEKLTATKTGMDEVKETQLDLRAGKIFGRVNKLSPASKYEIKLPNGVAGIRGTIYTVDAQGVVMVLTGSVVVAVVGPNGQVVTQVVNGGYSYDPRTGQLTPLTETQARDIQNIVNQVGQGALTEPTKVVVDETEIYVSPTAGTE